MNNNARITKQRQIYLSYIANNPGCNTAELDRACRTARNGHKWMYAAVKRMVRAGLVSKGPSASGLGTGLYVVSR